MKHFSYCLQLLKWLIPALLAVPLLAHAHIGTGTAHGWLHGFSHPLLGADDVLAMIAVGLWAVQMGGRAIWLVPLTFSQL
jgi:urease accessory protein